MADTGVRSAGDRGETGSGREAASQFPVDDPGGHSRYRVGDLAITLQVFLLTPLGLEAVGHQAGDGDEGCRANH